MVGERGLAPPRLTDSRSVGSAIPSEPLARKLVLPAGISPATSAFGGLRSDNCATGAAGAEPTNGASCRCCPGSTFLQRKFAGCREEAKWSQSPVLPWAQRAYETCLSAGSTAALEDGHLAEGGEQNGAPTRNCTRLACLPSRRIAQNALGASKMIGARRLARPRLPGSKPGGSAIPREPRAKKLVSLTGFAPVISCMRGRHVGWTTPQGQKDGEGKRIFTFDLMHVTHPLWLAELCPHKWWGRRVLPSLPLACQTSALLMSYVPRELERVDGVAPSPRPWDGCVLLLNHTRMKWYPQPDSHQQPGV